MIGAWERYAAAHGEAMSPCGEKLHLRRPDGAYTLCGPRAVADDYGGERCRTCERVVTARPGLADVLTPAEAAALAPGDEVRGSAVTHVVKRVRRYSAEMRCGAEWEIDGLMHGTDDRCLKCFPLPPGSPPVVDGRPARVGDLVEVPHATIAPRRAIPPGVPDPALVAYARPVPGGWCQACGEQVTLTANDPRQASVDHIQPRSKGGGEDLANKRLLCRECNGLKGDSWSQESYSGP